MGWLKGRNVTGTVQTIVIASKKWPRSVSKSPPPAIIQCDGQPWQCKMHAVNECSLRCHQTRIWSSCCYKQNRNSLKTRRYALPASRFVVERSTESALLCNAASSIAKAIATGLTVYASANIVVLFLKTLATLQRTCILDSWFVMWLYDPLKVCG